MSDSTSPSEDRVLGHSDECDGIDEYDNKSPLWIVLIFWVTVIWAPIYLVHYHFVAHRSQAKAYDAEVAAAAAMWPATEAPAEVAMTPDAIAAGEQVFKTNCVGCHGALLQGGIGPNLTDITWIHGGRIEDIQRTITEGVAAKGMPGWKPLLGQEKVNQVAAFVKSRALPAENVQHEKIEAEMGLPEDDNHAPAPEPGAPEAP